MTKKLNSTQTKEIAELYASGKHTTEKIALLYGVSTRTIQRIAKSAGVIRTIPQANKTMAKYKTYYKKDPKEKARNNRKTIPIKLRCTILSEHPYCSLCGRSPEQGVRLEIDHIDNDSSNNDPSNLQVLCGDCNIGKYWAGISSGNHH